MAYPKADPKIQYKPDGAKPKYDAYVHPLMTPAQMACRTRLTRGFEERDLTNYPAADRFAARQKNASKTASQENATYAEML